MPNRILRDGILASEKVAGLSWTAEVFYRRVMSVADDYGRFHGNPRLLRSACYPLQIDKVSDADIEKWLTECVTAALVSVYPAQDGKRYLEISNFGQQVRAKSKFPPPNDQHPQAPASNCYQSLANAHLVGVGVEVGDDIDTHTHTAHARGSFGASPPLETVLAYAGQIGLAEWRATDEWNKLEANGWLDGKGQAIRKWEAYFTRVKGWWEADGRPAGPKSNGSKATGRKSALDLAEEKTGRREVVKLKML